MKTEENKLRTFIKEKNPVLKNCICIYEQRGNKKNLLFQVDKRNFESDNEFQNAVDFILDSLKKNL